MTDNTCRRCCSKRCWSINIAALVGVVLALTVVQHGLNVAGVAADKKPGFWIAFAYREAFLPFYEWLGTILAHISSFITWLHLEDYFDSAWQIIRPILMILTGWIVDTTRAFHETVHTYYPSKEVAIGVGVALLVLLILSVVYKCCLSQRYKDAIRQSMQESKVFLTGANVPRGGDDEADGGRPSTKKISAKLLRSRSNSLSSR